MRTTAVYFNYIYFNIICTAQVTEKYIFIYGRQLVSILQVIDFDALTTYCYYSCDRNICFIDIMM